MVDRLETWTAHGPLVLPHFGPVRPPARRFALMGALQGSEAARVLERRKEGGRQGSKAVRLLEKQQPRRATWKSKVLGKVCGRRRYVEGEGMWKVVGTCCSRSNLAVDARDLQGLSRRSLKIHANAAPRQHLWMPWIFQVFRISVFRHRLC